MAGPQVSRSSALNRSAAQKTLGGIHSSLAECDPRPTPMYPEPRECPCRAQDLSLGSYHRSRLNGRSPRSILRCQVTARDLEAIARQSRIEQMVERAFEQARRVAQRLKSAVQRRHELIGQLRFKKQQVKARKIEQKRSRGPSSHRHRSIYAGD
jgi:hypothetical protein